MITNKCSECGSQIFLSIHSKDKSLMKALAETDAAVCNICEPKSSWKRKEGDGAE